MKIELNKNPSISSNKPYITMLSSSRHKDVWSYNYFIVKVLNIAKYTFSTYYINTSSEIIYNIT